MKRLSVFAVSLLLASCLKFGDNTELSGTEITKVEIETISKLTKLTLPVGTVGQHYYYLGDTMDPALSAKLTIPANKRTELLANDVFTKGKKEIQNLSVAKDKSWWKPEKLTNRMDKSLSLSATSFLVCSLGEEDGQLILYVTCVSM